MLPPHAAAERWRHKGALLELGSGSRRYGLEIRVGSEGEPISPQRIVTFGVRAKIAIWSERILIFFLAISHRLAIEKFV
jgi:hypothetical protein